MYKYTSTIMCIGISLLILGCGHNPNRAGCSYVDGAGSGQYGVPFQNVKANGDVKGAHVYAGDSIMDKVEITCNAEKQEVKIK